VPIAGDQVVDLLLANETLDHRHIDAIVGFAFAASDTADLLFVDAEEHRQLCNPLLEERLLLLKALVPDLLR
jgi:hypothetical protein